MTAPSKEERVRLRALLKWATPLPWRWWTSNSLRRLSSDKTGKDGDVGHAIITHDRLPDIVISEDDQAYSEAACNALPALLDAIDAVERRADVTLGVAEERGRAERHVAETLGAAKGESTIGAAGRVVAAREAWRKLSESLIGMNEGRLGDPGLWERSSKECDEAFEKLAELGEVER